MCIDLKYISKIIHSDLVLVTQVGNTFVSLGFIVILWVNWVDVVLWVSMGLSIGLLKELFMLLPVFPIDVNVYLCADTTYVD